MGKRTTTVRPSNSYPGQIKNEAKLSGNQTIDDRNGVPELRVEYKIRNYAFTRRNFVF